MNKKIFTFVALIAFVTASHASLWDNRSEERRVGKEC